MQNVLAILTTISLLALASTAGAQRELAPQEAKYFKNMLKQCEDGIPSACFRYGKESISLNRPGDKEKGIRFIRKACMMTYAPACLYKTTEGEDVESPKSICIHKLQEDIRVEFVSETGKQPGLRVTESSGKWLKAGLLTGDLIVSLNDEAAKSKDDFLKSLSAPDEIKLTILRFGSVLKEVKLTCP
jgi:hypothetical protein